MLPLCSHSCGSHAVSSVVFITVVIVQHQRHLHSNMWTAMRLCDVEKGTCLDVLSGCLAANSNSGNNVPLPSDTREGGHIWIS